MAIETRIQKRQTIQNVAYLVICLILGLWGWYDYAVKIPALEAAFREFVTAEDTRTKLEKLALVTPLNAEQRVEFNQARELLEQKYKEKPAEPAVYDRAVQLWLYIVGCGVLGVPWFAFAQWNLSRNRYRLNDDGSFESGTTKISAEQLTGINLSRWMSKSIAQVQTADGRKIDLDDYKYKGVEDIVAVLAARFHPGEWTSDARPIGDPKSRDTKKQAEAAMSAAASAATSAATSDESVPPSGSKD